MGCCASQPATTTATNTPPSPAATSKSKADTTSKTATEGSSKTSAAPPQQQQPKPTMNNSMSETPASAPPAASSAPVPTPVPDPAPAATPATGGGGGAAVSTTPGSYVAPAPGVKAVRTAYKGKGWAPPQKEYTTNEKKVGDKTRIEIQDEWDDDGNLRRTTVKHIITPDWKKKTEKTIEIIPADEAEKMGLGKKN
mmetsp:Transcript_23380/g.55423  ORF Transcript_23380/g.55423 Transcript_23380/m.55423 type:complete len:196 (-) Transcript_23380:378-965(-)|eukprot:CAMPEP_0113518008 /NCGR_PEP_ID=MMETSP0014_2-20120614/42603_1 /TAXON_ID=2857 /ORGANISM="Nitzschia sp." /LENGTH=195 /DNA_ID=CAMNT_0000415323 /DNA_START=204 /DNA_END=791 /DNA_ORIENTATION=+ /assembly_acc=CAM_ASM_000159